eukprot:TRINITY_DN12052_c0_g1_i3.p1 TRINITY_DN12052_c0_g1~~TRINITY_DN12052_c0_g1_i3.p1  ORF type:complete len:343 (-),score=92.41 TRINITY_DN12052_c0_g1_i3:99-1127(-)
MAAVDASKFAPIPATEPEVDTFIKGNKTFLNSEAEEVFRKMNPVDQKRVISDGGLRECMNPVAVLKTRARKAREAELILAGGKLPQRQQQSQPELLDLATYVPDQSLYATSFYMHGQHTVVKASESRFARPAGSVDPDSAAKEEAAPMEGSVADVGGVIEVGPKAKYGCTKGQRVRVVGSTPVLWLCKDSEDGDKMINKAHRNNGWRWILPAANTEAETKQKSSTEQKKAEEAAPKVDAKPDKKKDDDTDKKVETKTKKKGKESDEKTDTKDSSSKKAKSTKSEEKKQSKLRSPSSSPSTKKGRRKKQQKRKRSSSTSRRSRDGSESSESSARQRKKKKSKS